MPASEEGGLDAVRDRDLAGLHPLGTIAPVDSHLAHLLAGHQENAATNQWTINLLKGVIER
jgi:hypothetical protein